MGATTIRAHTLGISFGNPLSVEPDLDVFNEDAYEAIDFAILVARIYGIRVSVTNLAIIFLTTHWMIACYSNGGQCKLFFIQWRAPLWNT